VSPAALKQILRRRLAVAGQQPNVFNRDLGAALVQVAREWSRVDETVLKELRRLVGLMRVPATGLTPKNKATLRQFDDPAAVHLLFDLPANSGERVKRALGRALPCWPRAQAALAVAILSYMPLRPKNLTDLTFDRHLFLRDKVRAVSTVELPAEEVKNGTALESSIPPHVAKMLIEYRNRHRAGDHRHRPERLFVNVDGTPKCQEAVSDLITRTLRRRAGIVLTPHQFRHLSASSCFDCLAGQLCGGEPPAGHKNLKTSVNSMAGSTAAALPPPPAAHRTKACRVCAAGAATATKETDQNPGDVNMSRARRQDFDLRNGRKTTANAVAYLHSGPATSSTKAGRAAHLSERTARLI